MRRVLTIFRSRLFLVFLGVLALSLVVWYAGPLFGFAGRAPLESETARFATVGTLFGLWLSGALLRLVRSRWRNARMLDALAEAPPPPSASELAAAEELETLQRKMREAVDTLKRRNLSGKGGRRLVYELPWYLIIGPPGAGKTTLLANSGLDFPLEASHGRHSVKGVGGTRNCDWWFTDDAVLVDTAGRLAIDEAMMAEIQQLHAAIEPVETLFVVDSMTGQDAANTAAAFGEALPLTGIVLTKTDGDARGGAALSVRVVTGKPIKFIGSGEKADALEVFHPERIASRILGMGDVVSLVEEVTQKVDQDKAEKFARKMQKGKAFDLEDLKEQLEQMANMGGMAAMMDKLPGMADVPEAAKAQVNDRQFVHMIALVNSMTPGSLPYRQAARNEAITSLLARCPVDSTELQNHRTRIMDKRGEGVPIILSRSEELSGIAPQYRMLDDSELLLVVHAAAAPTPDVLPKAE